jgi:hypothetical protein
MLGGWVDEREASEGMHMCDPRLVEAAFTKLATWRLFNLGLSPRLPSQGERSRKPK